MKAYVIMPYGNVDPTLKKEFDKVFRFLIRTAVESYDPQIELLRQDYTGEGGYIISNIIDNLSKCDLVIADVSMLNWNVAYELGIRHAMSKSHTVIICDDKTKFPFDIQNLNIIVYSRDSWMDEIDEISDRIVQAIRNSLKTHHCDSPVHLQFPALPSSLIETLNSTNDAQQKRIAELTAENRQLTEENKALQEKLEAAGLDAVASDSRKKDLTQLFVTAVQNRELISDTAVDRLRELEREKDYEEFARFLAKVLEHGYLDETDCRNVYIICRRLGIPDITKQFIQIAVTFYPESEELQGFLANEYSNDYREKERAQIIANDMLGVKKTNGRFELIPKLRSERMLASFFNVYLHLKRFEDVIEVGKLLFLSNPASSSLILRNIALAARNLGKFELSYAAICHALHLNPLDDRNHESLFRHYNALRDCTAAYEALERMIVCDERYTDYYFVMAGFICDNLIARTSSGNPESISFSERENYAVPFILEAIRIDSTVAERAVAFLKKNSMDGLIPILAENFQEDSQSITVFGDTAIVGRCFLKSKADITAWVETLPKDLDLYI